MLSAILLQTNFSELDQLGWAGELFGLLVTISYAAYCIKQGILELKNDNLETPYLRILAIMIELFNVLTFVFILTQVPELNYISELPNFLIVTGMCYLLTQNIRIALGKS